MFEIPLNEKLSIAFFFADYFLLLSATASVYSTDKSEMSTSFSYRKL